MDWWYNRTMNWTEPMVNWDLDDNDKALEEWGALDFWKMTQEGIKVIKINRVSMLGKNQWSTNHLIRGDTLGIEQVELREDIKYSRHSSSISSSSSDSK